MEKVKGNTLKIGITGGIGSGKTTVCKIFEVLGIPVYYADKKAKALMVENEDVRESIRELLGQEAYTHDLRLNKAYIAETVFSNPDKLKKLNAIVHPAVFEDAANWHHSHDGVVPYTLKEAALLIESGSFRNLDKLIVITAPEDIRIQRVMQRDQVTEKEVRARMNNQIPENKKREFADFLIDNSGNTSLLKQVWTIHRQLLALHKSLTNK